jgi:hypothetical protein
MSDAAGARLVLRQDPRRSARLSQRTPLTIGRADDNLLRLASMEAVAPHHAVVRFSLRHGWLVCDWGSAEGTWLEGRRLRNCRPLGDGDEIQLGPEGPVLVFQLVAAASPAASAAAPAAPAPTPPAGRSIELAGRRLPLAQVRSAHLQSRALYPHSFSWWVLIALGALVLLPWPWLFWGLQIAALAAWIVLGSRKEHLLVVTLHDGMAVRHRFANRVTALGHRNGIRKAIGLSLVSG